MISKSVKGQNTMKFKNVLSSYFIPSGTVLYPYSYFGMYSTVLQYKIREVHKGVSTVNKEIKFLYFYFFKEKPKDLSWWARSSARSKLASALLAAHKLFW